MEKIKIGILGYGNLGKAVEKIVKKQPDMELVGIYSRRNLNHPLACSMEQLEKGADVDVLLLCTGSATDLPNQTPLFAKLYHVVDSFDYHQQIEAHYRRVDAAAKESGHLALISCGWDPGLFSIIRSLFAAVIPEGTPVTFWGKGVSQGHSDAIRRIKGVKDGRQYTVPLEGAIEEAKAGVFQEMDVKRMHRRECFVVAEPDADLKRIEDEIKNMPGYFLGYKTTVHFISQETLEAEHRGFPHGGMIISVGDVAKAGFSLELSSNPDFTAAVIVAYGRALFSMAKRGETGCKTVLDIPFGCMCSNMFMHM